MKYIFRCIVNTTLTSLNCPSIWYLCFPPYNLIGVGVLLDGLLASNGGGEHPPYLTGLPARIFRSTRGTSEKDTFCIWADGRPSAATKIRREDGEHPTYRIAMRTGAAPAKCSGGGRGSRS